MKAQISQLKANKSDVTGILLPQPLESQNFQLQDTINKLQKENDCFQAENSKIKQHYKELYDSIKITRATHIEKITSLLNEIETLKTQVKGKMPVITNVNVIPKGYLNRLKDNLDTLREIVEEAISKRSSDNSLESACIYTKTSQEFPSIEVSRSKPRSNIKNDRTSTAKSVPKNKVEDHIRNTKSDLQKQNRVDSSISLKRTSSNKPPVKKVWTVKQVMQTWKATEKLFANVGYQWKPTGRKFTLGEQCPLSRITKPKVVPVQQWKPTGRTIPLGEQCPVTRSIASTSAPIVVET
ncbi:hypothetical protein Tco_0746816 [Tanacetum coccineum]